MKLRKVWKVVIALAIVATIVFISTQLWWTENGYCIGSFVECNL